MSEIIVSTKMPILALRGLAVFPDQTIHFDVGRIKSALALEKAMKSDQKIFWFHKRMFLMTIHNFRNCILWVL